MTFNLRGLYVGLVERTAPFGASCRLPGGAVAWRRRRECRSCGSSTGRPWKEIDGYRRRSPCAPLTRREPADGAPALARAGDTLPGTVRANPPARERGRIPGDRAGRRAAHRTRPRSLHPHHAQPAGSGSLTQMADRCGAARLRGDLVASSSSDTRRRRSPDSRGSTPTRETPPYGTQPRWPAVGRDDRRSRLGRTNHRPHATIARRDRPACRRGGQGGGGGVLVGDVWLEDPLPFPLPRVSVATDSRPFLGRRHFSRARGNDRVSSRRKSVPGKKSEHYRPQSLRNLVLDGRPRDLGSSKALPW